VDVTRERGDLPDVELTSAVQPAVGRQPGGPRSRPHVALSRGPADGVLGHPLEAAAVPPRTRECLREGARRRHLSTGDSLCSPHLTLLVSVSALHPVYRRGFVRYLGCAQT
jgi:hypothetical protein